MPKRRLFLWCILLVSITVASTLHSSPTDPNQAFLITTIGNLVASQPPDQRQSYLLTLRQAIKQMQSRPSISPARRRLLALMLVATHHHLALTTSPPWTWQTPPISPPPESPLPPHILTMMWLVNERRRAAWAPTLVLNPLLTSVAQSYAETLVTAQIFSHTWPDGKKVTDRVRDAGYRFQRVAENLANTRDPEEAFDLLRNSPWHRANMLNPSMTHRWVARHDTIRVQVFALPAH